MIELGYMEETWDCCINHYTAWTYEEISDFGKEIEDPLFKISLKVLGWNEGNWGSSTSSSDGTVDIPRSEEKSWKELNLLEKGAAEYLCYTQSLWDEEALISTMLF